MKCGRIEKYLSNHENLEWKKNLGCIFKSGLCVIDSEN